MEDSTNTPSQEVITEPVIQPVLEKIPFKRINLGNALEEIKPLIESGFIGLGNKVFEFEKALAEYVGAKYCAVVDSCTSALFLSLTYEKMKGNYQTLVIPSMTVPLVADAIIEAGFDFKFDDRTSWVGSAYRIKGSRVIDSAHQLERNQFVNMGLEFEDKLCFSFYPTKNIGSADGGAICSNDKDFIDWVRMVSSYGRNQTQKYQNSWEYEVEVVGYKRHYTNLQAAICLEQLNRLDETNSRRAEIRDMYNLAFGYKNVSLYLYRINIADLKRDEFIAYMKEKGIECGVHFKPLHLMKAFKDHKFVSYGNKNIVEGAYCETVSLPFFDLMTDDQVVRVISAVKESPFILDMMYE